MAKVGNLFKLDAICAKLKTNLENKTQYKDTDKEENNNDNPAANSAKTLVENGQPVTDEAEEVLDLAVSENDAVKPGNGNNEIDETGFNDVIAGDDDAVPDNLSCDMSSGVEMPEGDYTWDGCNSSADEYSFNTYAELFDKSESKTETETRFSSSTSRKHRRKNFRPRSIAQFKQMQQVLSQEEVEEYKDNNKGVDFGSDTDDDSQSALDLSASPFFSERQRLLPSTTNAVKEWEESNKMDVTTNASTSAPLDLSLSRIGSPVIDRNRNTNESREMTDDVNKHEEATANVDHMNFPTPLQFQPLVKTSEGGTKDDGDQPGIPNPLNPAHNTEATVLKDYAERTMNELLNMYGLESEGDSIPKDVSLHPYIYAKILDKQATNVGIKQEKGDNQAPSTGMQHLPVSAFNRPIKLQPPKFELNKFIPARTDSPKINLTPKKEPGVEMKRMETATTEAEDSMTSEPEDGMYSKFVDTMTKLAKVPHGKSAVNSFTSSAAYIKACFDPQMAPQLHAAAASTPKRLLLPDYSKYLRRYTSSDECVGEHCRDMGYKEHFHCMDCNLRVFVRKEEMIRHFKWHKKRDESLQHGFLRFSPMDDCAKKYGTCTHNGRQTHYHCLQSGCNKVYISTSDVQMHANYHRKDSAILQEGFQRFRATEDCGTQTCSFYGQRTTHFHCRRSSCHFTFKNKADMEKHKTYHQKDEVLARDGFKKFMKYEHCKFTGCRYSKLSNHIHCIRQGCDYVLHSTGQLYSHKRKHERRDFEHAYKRFKDGQRNKTVVVNPAIKPLLTSGSVALLATPSAVNTVTSSPSLIAQPMPLLKRENEFMDLEDFVKLDQLKAAYKSSVDTKSALQIPGELGIQSESSLPTSLAVSASDTSSEKSTSPVSRLELNPPNRLDEPSSNLSLTPTSSTSSLLEAGSGIPEDMLHETTADNLTGNKALPSTLAKLACKIQGSSLGDSLTLPIPGLKAEKKESVTAVQAPTAPEQETVSSPTFVMKISPLVNEKRERDEGWKKYLTRYTANDPCHSRCQFLYKDHYHCNQNDCGMLFRSKDGVRDHAKQHEHQERITGLSFMKYDEPDFCMEGCSLYKKCTHYHCLWADCKQVISCEDAFFSRLEHHKIHEYARTAVGKKLSPTAVSPKTPESLKRRRGRPPKYPKTEIPTVPKIEMTEEEITAHVQLGAESCMMSGFKKFADGQPCPDEKCPYYMREHYHCVRKRCHHATDRLDNLNLHAKDFHSYINILDGFEFFERTVNCRRPHCHNNRANRHFHCVRPKCDYSFVRYSTMAQHDKKHKMAEMGLTPSPGIGVPKVTVMPTPINNSFAFTTLAGSPNQVLLSSQVSNSGNSSGSQNIVKATGTFYPVSPTGSLTTGNHSGVSVAVPIMLPLPSLKSTATGSASAGLTSLVLQQITPSSTAGNYNATTGMGTARDISRKSGLVNIAPKPPLVTGAPLQPSGGPPLALLLQKATASTPQVNWLTMKTQMHCNTDQNCGRPFCKLKKKEHFHCFDCNQAFSDPIRLKVHVSKHGIVLDKSDNIQGNRILAPVSMAVVPAPGTSPGPSTDSLDDYEKIHCSGNVSEVDEETHQVSEALSTSRKRPIDAYHATSEPKRTRLNETAEIDKIANWACLPDQGSDEGSYEEDNDDEQGNLVIDLSMGGPKPPKLDDFSASTARENCHFKLEGEADNNGFDRVTSPKQGDGEIHEGTSQHDVASPNADFGYSGDSASARRSGRKRTATKHADFIDADDAMAKPKREESVPEGYEKFRFKEECHFDRCAYRLNMTHYHCIRNNCRFSFTDRSRILQHNDRHTRLDAIMGDAFQQFRANVDCERFDCEHSNKSTHYHCLKCPFICTDTTKVAAHRKHHTKLDSIAAQGFAKFTGPEDCAKSYCAYRGKQTHYHCTHQDCSHTALGPAQMNAHSEKHQRGDLNA